MTMPSILNNISNCLFLFQTKFKALHTIFHNQQLPKTISIVSCLSFSMIEKAFLIVITLLEYWLSFFFVQPLPTPHSPMFCSESIRCMAQYFIRLHVLSANHLTNLLNNLPKKKSPK